MRKTWFRQGDKLPIVIPMPNGVDLTSALSAAIYVKKPDGEDVIWVVDHLEAEDKVIHQGRDGDFDIPGIYNVAVYVKMPDGDLLVYAGQADFMIEVRPLANQREEIEQRH